MESNISCKTINRPIFIASSLLVLTVAFTSQGHASTVVVSPQGSRIYIGGLPNQYGYGYRHGGYYTGHGTAYHRWYYGHGTGYRRGYRGNTVYHHNDGRGTVIHNGNVRHYNRR